MKRKAAWDGRKNAHDGIFQSLFYGLLEMMLRPFGEWRKHAHVKEVGHPISHPLQKLTGIAQIPNVAAKTIKLIGKKRYNSQSIVLKCIDTLENILQSLYWLGDRVTP